MADQDAPFGEYMTDLRRSVYADANAVGIARHDILPTSWLKPIAAKIGDWRVPQRSQEVAQRVWQKLVKASCTPYYLGRLPTGSVPKLAEKIREDDGTVSRLLKRWEGVTTVRHYGPRTRGPHPPVEWIEVVPVAVTLDNLVPARVVVLSETWSNRTEGRWVDGGTRQLTASSGPLYRLLMTTLERGWPFMYSITSTKDVKGYLAHLPALPPQRGSESGPRPRS